MDPGEKQFSNKLVWYEDRKWHHDALLSDVFPTSPHLSPCCFCRENHSKYGLWPNNCVCTRSTWVLCCQLERPPVGWLFWGQSRTSKRMLWVFSWCVCVCVWVRHRSVASGQTLSDTEWSWRRKQNEDRCQRAVVMLELIRSAGCSPLSPRIKTRERCSGDGPCGKRLLHVVLGSVIERRGGGSRRWRGTAGSGGNERTSAARDELHGFLRCFSEHQTGHGSPPGSPWPPRSGHRTGGRGWRTTTEQTFMKTEADLAND